MIAKAILYFGKPRCVTCDAKCNKAWGINSRPRVRFDEDDDYAFLADGELGEAPDDLGTYEGMDGKPLAPEMRLNKWCVRECERAEKGDLGQLIEVRDYSARVYNQPWKHERIK